ncbi:MAG: helix-turn-helix domain-containing protein [Candidatus Brocadiales bacterium]|nr:helix-turn-helix domain-containing protein [Candidatus Bathyanammoxibius sp.]
MPAPNNKMDRETQKALVRVKLEEGKTYKQVADEVGISTHTVYRWNKETVSQEEMETVKRALTAMDLETLSKSGFINNLVLEAIIKKASNGELDKEDLKTLSRVGVDVSKIHGIHWDKVMMRDGTLDPGQTKVSPATMLALLLAKATSDREAANRLEQERAMYETAKGKGKGSDIIDVGPSS